MRRALWILAPLLVLGWVVFLAMDPSSTGAGEALDTDLETPVATVEAKVDQDLQAPQTSDPEVRAAASAPPSSAPFVIAGHLRRGAPGCDPADALPMEGIEVDVAFFLEGAGRPYDGTLTTDADGAFRVEVANPKGLAGSVRVSTDGRPHYQRARRSFVFEAGTRSCEACDLLQYETAPLEGRVVDEAGAPVEGATYRIRDLIGTLDVTTDVDGRFRIPRVYLPMDPVLEKEGWFGLALTTPDVLEGGFWEPVEGVMGPAATLAVTLETARGVPIEGTWVTADIAPIEAVGGAVEGWAPWEPKRTQAQTNEAGRAVLEGIAASKRVRIRILGHGFEHVREEDGLLVGAEEGGRPLVLAPGEHREVVVREGPTIELAGKVLEPDGTPSPNAILNAWALDGDGAKPRHLDSVRTEADGTFAWSFVSERIARRVILVAHGTIGEERSLSPFGGSSPPDPLHAGHKIVEIDDEGRGPTGVVIQLTVMDTIEGVVRNAAGEPTAADILVRECNPGPLRAGLLGNLYPQQRAGKDGAFRLKGVPPGRYDLAFHSDEHGNATLTKVQGGATGLEVRLIEEEPATVTFEVDGPGGAQDVSILVGRLTPLAVDVPSAPPLARTMFLVDPVGWPASVMSLASGVQSASGDIGSTNDVVSPIEGTSVTRTLRPGLYRLGVRGSDGQGRRCAPMGTGLVRIDPGAYTLHVALTPTAHVSGRVRPYDGAKTLFVEIALEDGTVVPVDGGRGEFAPRREVGADGSFDLGHVPALPLELRVGTATQLASDTPVWSGPLHAEAGSERQISIEL